MNDTLCEWLSYNGRVCNKKLNTSIKRQSKLKFGPRTGKMVYLCKEHVRKNSNGPDYNKHKSQRKANQREMNKTENAKKRDRERNIRRYFSRAGHPFFVWNAAKNYWSREMGQKFKLTHRQVITLHISEYNRLYTAWEKLEFQERLTPMITKLHFKKEYSKYNFRWITFKVAGYNPRYMKEVMSKANAYHKNLLKRSREAGGKHTEYEFL